MQEEKIFVPVDGRALETPQTAQENADIILTDKKAINATMASIIDDKKRMKEIKVTMDKDCGLKRYVGRQTRNPETIRIINSMSMSDKLSYKKSMENCENTRQTDGQKCILIKGKKESKQVLFPEDPEKLKGSEEIYLSTGLVLVFFRRGGKVNRVASSIAGEKIEGDAYIKMGNGEDFTIEQFSKMI